MSIKTRPGLPAAAAVVAALVVAGYATASGSSEKAPMATREKALHVLNRLSFGPRPGDVDNVMEMGVAAYIERQLTPERIPDPAVAEKLKDLRTLRMSQAELIDAFEKPIQEARRRMRQEMASRGVARADESDASEVEIQKYRAMIPPEQRPRRVIEELSAARVLRAAYSERQFNEVLVDFWMNHFNVYAGKGLDRILLTSFERDVIRPGIWGRFEDLLMATARSPAMLFYLDNARSVADREHRPASRPSAWRGFFAAKGFRGMDPDMAERIKNAPRGINENYARELMELHTLGVDGGYTQKDVTELARVLTGWSIDRRGPDGGGGFVFRDRMHDNGSKTALGHTFPAGGGIEEGEQMIRILAHHPATAHHVAWKLVQRLVADEPPRELVDRAAQAFAKTGGDLRETVRAIVLSPEFFDPQFYRAKVKSPFEYVVSAVRAVNASTDGRAPILREIAQMGEPLYMCQPPTGYSDAAQAWINTGALLERLNFALALAGNRLPGTEADVEALLHGEDAANPNVAVDALARIVIGGDLSEQTRETIEKRLSSESPSDLEGNARLQMIAGLILGSPEFQRQ